MSKIFDHAKSLPAAEDYRDSCRVCLTTSLNLKNIFDERNHYIIEKIEFCTGLLYKKEDCFPTLICKLCLRSLSVAYSFKKKCLNSEEIFRNLCDSKLEVNKYIKAISEKDVYNNDNFNVIDSDDESKCFDSLINDMPTADIKQEEVDGNNFLIEVKGERIDEDSNERVKIIEPKRRSPSEGKIKIHFTRPRKEKVPCLLVRSTRPRYRRLFCEECNVKFKNRQESLQHKKEFHKRDTIRKVMPDGRTPWVCEICGKCYAHRPSLETHVASHFSPQNECDYCGYRSCYKSDLIKHIRIHTGDKKYKCDQCPSAFHTSSNLRNHKRRVHENIRRFACTRSGCEKAFCERAQLERHLDAHDSVKRFKCEICHSELSRRNHWKKHMMRQHKIVIPRAKAGRRRTNFLVETDSEEDSVWKAKRLSKAIS